MPGRHFAVLAKAKYMMRRIIWDLPEEAAFSLRHGQKTAGGTDYIAKTAIGSGCVAKIPTVAGYRCNAANGAECLCKDCRCCRVSLQRLRRRMSLTRLPPF